MTIEARPTRDGAAFTIVCRPRAPKTRSRGSIGAALKLDVGAPPERGQANEEIVRFLARALGLARASLRISAGAAAREKSVRVLGMTCAELLPRLRTLEAEGEP